MKRITTLVVVGMLGGIALAGMSSAPYTPINASTGAVKPGEWNASIAKGKAYAEAHNMPMLAVGGSVTCGGCHVFQTACNTDEFKVWAAKKQIVMVFGTDVETRKFCQAELTTLPFVCIYWPFADGSVMEEHFSAVSGQMPSKAGETLQAQFMASCDLYIGDYPQITGREYLAFTDDYENARLEAQVGLTAYVDVPITRDSVLVGHVGTNRFTAVCNGTTLVDETVVWDAAAKDMYVRVAIPADVQAGDTIQATLLRMNGEECGVVGIHVVGEVENCTKNPLFLGERTADTLQYGEWTMDLDVAMEKYRKEPDSHLMAMASGSLWCPDCVMTDGHVLETDAFRNWAVDNKVILVAIDVPNFGPRESSSACLLTRTVVKQSDSYVSGRGTLATNEAQRYQSGAGYLSRHMVSDQDAMAVLERNRSLVGRNTLEGGWNNPERANQYRTGIPNFFALRRDGSLAGTFETFDAIGPSEFNDAYLARFSELIALGETDDAEFDNRAWQTTKDIFAGTGESAVATLTPLDLVDTYWLSPSGNQADMQTVVVKGNGPDATITVSLISVINGATKVVSTAMGSLVAGVAIEGVISESGDYYLQVKGDATGALAVDSASGAQVAYTLSGSRTEIENPFSNDWIAKASVTTIPLFAPDGKTLQGILALNLKKNKKIAARYSNGGKVLASFSAAWDANIAADGTAVALAEKGSFRLVLSMSSEGAVSAELSDGVQELSSGPCRLQEEYGEFTGLYTAVVPSRNIAMTLSVSGSGNGLKRGQLKYKICLPNGLTLSGNTNLTGLDADFAIAPILKTKGAETFAVALKVRRNAAKAPTRRAILAYGGSDEIYGSFYDKSAALNVLSGTDTLALRVDPLSLAPQSDFGALVAATGDGDTLAVSAAGVAAAAGRWANGFSLRFNRATGLFTGRTTLDFERKERVKATIRGVILPGWFSDCECSEDGDSVVPLEYLDFGIGFAVFSDTVGGRRVKRGVGVSLGAD